MLCNCNEWLQLLSYIFINISHYLTLNGTIITYKIIYSTDNQPLNNCLMFKHSILQLERQHIQSIQVTVVSSEIQPIVILWQAETRYNLYLAVNTWDKYIPVKLLLKNYTVSRKTCHHQTHVHIFAKYWMIFKILSLAHSVKSLQ